MSGGKFEGVAVEGMGGEGEVILGHGKSLGGSKAMADAVGGVADRAGPENDFPAARGGGDGEGSGSEEERLEVHD